MIMSMLFFVAGVSQAPASSIKLATITGDGGNEKSAVWKVVDSANGVVCYVVRQNYCMGECAYSPAISCVKVENPK